MSEKDALRIVDLLLKYTRNGLSVEEDEELRIWINNHPSLFEELTSENIFEDIGEEYRSKQRILTAIREKISTGSAPEMMIMQKNTQVVKRIAVVSWRAAAIVLILGATVAITLVGVNTHKGKPVQAVVSKDGYKKDLPPGGNKATLTLAGGSIIFLDSIHNGTLTTEEGASISKSDGRLAYKVIREGGPINGRQGLTFNTLTTPRAGQYFLELSDGSKVWLNAASSLKYPVSFNSAERRVELSGEAYFEIAKSFVTGKKKARPFVVDIAPSAGGAKEAQIQVLGTHFNVNAYSDEAQIKTTLLEGSIKLSTAACIANSSRKQSGNGSVTRLSMVLSPGQQGQIDNPIVGESSNNDIQRKIQVINNADTGESVSWKNGMTSFKNDDIKGIMRKISRWYDADIIYQGDIPERIFVGGIPRNSNLSDVLKVLELNNIHFEVEGKKIIVKP